METLDDILYPFYMDFYSESNDFYSRNIKTLKAIFKDNSDNGNFCIRYTKAKDGNYCYATEVLYKQHYLINGVGYKTRDIALIAIIDSLRHGDFEKRM